MARDNSVHIVTLDNAINTLAERRSNVWIVCLDMRRNYSVHPPRIIAALSSKAKRGQFKSSVPPYGYRLDIGKRVFADGRVLCVADENVMN